MKKLNLFLVALASLAVLATSCKEDPKKVTPPAEVTLGVSGGTSVELKGADIVKDIIITASQAPESDINVSLTTTAAADEAKLSATTAVIKAGEKTATVKITFLAAKFPKGTPEKKIGVTITTSSDNAKVDVPSTEFAVKGDGGESLPKLTITGSGDANTTKEDVKYTLTFTLDNAAKSELPITLTLGSETDEAIKALLATMPTPKIAAEAKTLSLDLVTIPKGTAGKLIVNFAVESKEVVLETSSLTATFTVDKPTVTPLCAGPKNRGSYYMCKQFKVGNYTSTEHTATVAFTDLIASGTEAKVTGGDEITVIGKNKNSGATDLYKAYAWVDWNADGLLDDATERVMYEDLVAGANDAETTVKKVLVAPSSAKAGIYAMRIGTGFATNIKETEGVGGCASYETVDFTDLLINFTPGQVEPGADPTYSIERVSTGDIVVPTTGDKVEKFKVKLSAAAEEEVTINLAATSTTAANGTLSATSVKFAKGEGTEAKEVSITFASSVFTSDAVKADVTVTASHANLTATTGSILFKVKGTSTAPVGKQDLQYWFGKKNMDAVFGASDQTKVLRVQIGADNQASTQVGDVKIKLTVTGEGVATSDYSIPNNGVVTIAKADAGSKYVDVTINKSAIGKSLVFTMTSDETTLQQGSNVLTVTAKAAAAKEDLDIWINDTEKTVSMAGKNSQTVSTHLVIDAPDTQVKDLTIKMVVTGAGVTTSDYTLPGNGTITFAKADNGRKPIEIVVNKSAVGKVITVTMTSDDTTFQDAYKAIAITVTE